MSFLYFYVVRFKPSEHAVTIEFNDPIMTKADVKKVILQSQTDKDDFIERIDEYAYMILDPFDHGYNPGKAVKIKSPVHKSYVTCMTTTMLNTI